MINNAADKPVSTNLQLPQMGETLNQWFLPITFGLVTTTVVDFEKVVAVTNIDTKGVVQPAGEEILDLLPEGDRSWNIIEVHCLPNIELKNGEFVFYNGVKYMVLRREIYNQYGYNHYVLREAFTDE